ncbi:hypothetical protein A5765_00270 [Mycolicibacterium celeriflavum]|uniref:hypothetical protein n=1 Tax=Mycolicibacterium celeriflavum TaxID=1249101 RepID=UPI0007FCF11D|nr:hypothetical protein [Mycolicibacterium celeriflavum]OBG15580.1 hypothetical protein A5765_00270 [Mycolicibacterium celeriflavum]
MPLPPSVELEERFLSPLLIPKSISVLGVNKRQPVELVYTLTPSTGPSLQPMSTHWLRSQCSVVCRSTPHGVPDVVNRVVGILAGILDDAVEHRALALNPARRFKPGEKPRNTPKRHVYLKVADVCRMAEDSRRHADLVLTLAFTGLRWGRQSH